MVRREGETCGAVSVDGKCRARARSLGFEPGFQLWVILVRFARWVSGGRSAVCGFGVFIERGGFELGSGERGDGGFFFELGG